MREFVLRITFEDNSRGLLDAGWHASGIDAVLSAMQWWPKARCISAMRPKPLTTTAHQPTRQPTHQPTHQPANPPTTEANPS